MVFGQEKVGVPSPGWGWDCALSGRVWVYWVLLHECQNSGMGAQQPQHRCSINSDEGWHGSLTLTKELSWKDNPVDFPVNRSYYSQVWSQTVGSDRVRMLETRGRVDFPPQGVPVRERVRGSGGGRRSMWEGSPPICLTGEVAPGPRMAEDMLEGLFLNWRKWPEWGGPRLLCLASCPCNPSPDKKQKWKDGFCIILQQCAEPMQCNFVVCVLVVLLKNKVWVGPW